MDPVYDADFLFDECGFGWVPPHIDRTRLFNVSYEVVSGEIKLYVLDDSGSLLYKIDSAGTITEQRSFPAAGKDSRALQDFLGEELDFTDVVIDTVEDDIFYVYIEPSSPTQYVTFLGAVCRRFGFSKSRLVQVVNRLNRRPIESVFDCMQNRSVSGAKIPLSSNQVKFYSRPFLTGNGFDLDAASQAFLRRLYRCPAGDLQPLLRHLWVSGEIFSDRVILTTQRHAMVHGRT